VCVCVCVQVAVIAQQQQQQQTHNLEAMKLRQKILCRILGSLVGGILLTVGISTALLFQFAPSWMDNTSDRMLMEEQSSLGRIALNKARFLAENFDQVSFSVFCVWCVWCVWCVSVCVWCVCVVCACAHVRCWVLCVLCCCVFSRCVWLLFSLCLSSLSLMMIS